MIGSEIEQKFFYRPMNTANYSQFQLELMRQTEIIFDETNC